MAYVSKSIMKKDAMALITGKPVYTQDMASKDCLVVKVLRSPHASAIIKDIKTDIAMKVPGIECVGEIADESNSDLSKGDKIVALMGGMGRSFDGSYAEYALLPKKNVFKIIIKWRSRIWKPF